jgi:cytidylate kinase
MVITIDGTVGSGKSTAAAGLARRLGAVHLDTGAMYRALTLKALRAGVDLEDPDALGRMAEDTRIDLETDPDAPRVLLDGLDVTAAIRENRISTSSHYIAGAAPVRRVMVRLQREFAARAGDVVAEGRDQGTVVFPDALVKFYLDADPAVRARRRQGELRTKGEVKSYRSVLDEVLERDRRDSTREADPLRAAADAVHVDTTDLDVEAMIRALVQEVRSRAGEAP